MASSSTKAPSLRSVKVRFSGDYVAGLTQANGGNLAVRLEPLLIGGLYPPTTRTVC